jgi:pimeloyl-ACP methyl ester carboxylesterase
MLEKRIDIGNGHLAARLAGSGPLVLLVHGGEQDKDYFAPVQSEISGYTTIAYDRRGYSDSSESATTADQDFIAVQVDDAARLLSAVGGRSATIFGTSSGAVIAMQIAIAQPQLVSRLILHEPAWLEHFPQVAAGLRHEIYGPSGDSRPAERRANYKPANSAYWKSNEFEPTVRHSLDDATLRAMPFQKTVCIGTGSPTLHQALFAFMAWRIGAQIRSVVGAHEPLYGADKQLFARQLAEILQT